MASALLDNPHKLLLLTPLVASTSTVTYAVCEALFYSPFTHAPFRRESRALLPKWFKRVFDTNIYLLVGLNMVTISSATALLTLPGVKDILTARGSRNFFAAGLVGTCAHFVFASTMLGIIDKMTSDEGVSEEKDGDCTEVMRGWLAVHYVRLVVADVPAWGAYLAGVLATLSL
ncbi:hypothetical protein BDV19DRAFT_395289 [Aspergillus venezuelensis]